MLKLIGKKYLQFTLKNFVYLNMCKSISLITLGWLETQNLAQALIIDPTVYGRSAKALAKLRGRAGSPESNRTVISIWLLVGFHPATRSVQCTPADKNARKRAQGSI